MKELLQLLGFSGKPEKNKRKSAFWLVIKNPDGSPRWIWPAELNKPLFLKFYNAGNWRAKCFEAAIRLIFLFKLQGFCFKKQLIYGNEEETLGENLNLLQFSNWAVFAGTIGPNRKILVYSETGQQGLFWKVAPNSGAAVLLENEKTTIEKVRALNVEGLTIPHIRDASAGILALSDISQNGKRVSKMLPGLIKILGQISRQTGKTIPLNQWQSWYQTRADLARLTLHPDSRIPSGMLNKLEILVRNIKLNYSETTLAHGDLTPWNLFQQNDGVAVYDWELSREDYPLGFDAFHFIIQQGILVERKPWKEIRKEIESQISQEELNKWSAWGRADFSVCLGLYLVINTVRQLRLFAAQEAWHIQVGWLLDTWNEALSDVLQTVECSRRLVIADTFDMLRTKSYAALKFPEINPMELSEFSDIDLCLSKRDAEALTGYLSRHALVANCRIDRKSFMNALTLVLVNGRILHLDLIWRIKRTTQEMMASEPLRGLARPNSFGVKMPQPLWLARYVGLFYGLNNAKAPEKYGYMKAALEASSAGLDKTLVRVFEEEKPPVAELKKEIAALPENKGLYGLANLITYLWDTFQGLFSGRGLVITFSGVDGAGKSTVMEEVAHEFEKRLRKRVVLLRHRPSLLPILSAWVLGKKAAEQKSISRLPRQGTNKSGLSSLLRFGYYYCDYLIGQFFIHFRYKLRGYVVLYDRYYFDFINDGERSNIRLPQGIARSGWKLLLEPDLNFFLYADAETILARKQELDAETIKNLTNRYQNLFRELDKTGSGQYRSIYNDNLSNTVRIVVNDSLKKAV